MLQRERKLRSRCNFLHGIVSPELERYFISSYARNNVLVCYE